MLSARRKYTEVIWGVSNSRKPIWFLAAQALCYHCALLGPDYLTKKILSSGSSESHAADIGMKMSFLNDSSVSVETHFLLTLQRTFLYIFKQQAGVSQFPHMMAYMETGHFGEPVIILFQFHSKLSFSSQISCL